jgi:hypothetical protein
VVGQVSLLDEWTDEGKLRGQTAREIRKVWSADGMPFYTSANIKFSLGYTRRVSEGIFLFSNQI